MRHSDRSQNSFGDIARLLSDFFRDIDVVPSDVVAGLILLRKYQKIERESIVKQVRDFLIMFWMLLEAVDKVLYIWIFFFFQAAHK